MFLCPADVLPAMASFLSLFHLLWFLLYFLTTYELESTGLKYDCDEAYLLRAANYRWVVCQGRGGRAAQLCCAEHCSESNTLDLWCPLS